MGKKQNNLVESARDAIIGYTTVVLALACFILTLIVLVVAVRFIVGLGDSTSAVAGNATAAVATSTLHTGGLLS